MTLKINKEDIGEKIYFLQNYDNIEKYLKYYIKNVENHKLNINNYVILINEKIYKSKRYFEP